MAILMMVVEMMIIMMITMMMMIPMDVTLVGIVTAVSDVHAWKAEAPRVRVRFRSN
jgi:hypothetical protein